MSKNDKIKLDSLEILFKGYYDTVEALEAEYPPPLNPNDYAGFYAYVRNVENAS
jgi:hypothetical protein